MVIYTSNVCMNSLIKHVIEGKIQGMRRRERRGEQLLSDPPGKRRYWDLKEEVLACTLWRIRFGRGHGHVTIQTTEWVMNEWIMILRRSSNICGLCFKNLYVTLGCVTANFKSQPPFNITREQWQYQSKERDSKAQYTNLCVLFLLNSNLQDLVNQ
jgi:hypothetical protein